MAYYHWRAAHLQGREVSRWRAPVVDAIEDVAATTAHAYSAWGHRKIWAMLRRDGAAVSQSPVKRALARRGLLQPVRYQAERRAFAHHRGRAAARPPAQSRRGRSRRETSPVGW